MEIRQGFLIISCFAVATLSAPCSRYAEFEPVNKFCIWVGSNRSTFFDSDAECRAGGGYLLIVDSYLHYYLRYNSSLQYQFLPGEDFAWIDGIDFYNPYNFTDRNNKPLEELSSKWASGQPDITANNKNCLKADFTQDYYFYNEKCDILLQPICYIDIVSAAICPSTSQTTMYYPKLYQCFWVDESLTTFSGATSKCQASGDANSNLAKISTAEVNQFLLDNMKQYVLGETRLWIGFDDQASDGVYKWTDGSDVVYFNWGASYPYSTRDCGTLFTSNFQWAEYYCYSTTYLKSLCYKNVYDITLPSIAPRSAPTTPSITTDSLTTTEVTTIASTPDVQTTITTGQTFPTTTVFVTSPQSSLSVTTVLSNGLELLPTTIPISGICFCPCDSTGTTLTAEQLATKVKQLQNELYLDKKSTTGYKRTKVSIYDNRWSSQSIGIVGILILVIVFGSVFLMDIVNLFLQLKLQRDARQLNESNGN